ncbi:LPS assembly lipoprotein LptE [uncultured Neptuniibacter sp.]|uniref:LPS-assembly lipoprotein LptE n=1 Tax=uncultured Neptuniibacter sp. TaxID=502143 RepID=UPI002622AC66|nr:LPS assembly lipoprotein LptE [uncultured Neptuniibacter sp.]
MLQHWKAITIKFILISLTFSLLTACGFHLRGVQDVSAEKSRVTLIANNASNNLLQSLRQNMKFNGIIETQDAPYQLHILDHRYKRRTVTLNSDSDVDEYELSVEVTYLIADSEGKPLSSDIRLQRERSYTYDKDAATASSEQESQLKRELYESVAQSILRRYLANK